MPWLVDGNKIHDVRAGVYGVGRDRGSGGIVFNHNRDNPLTASRL
jgi:hypothetical protein